jgi:hypothetical protein
MGNIWPILREQFDVWRTANLGRKAFSGEFLEDYVAHVCRTFLAGEIDDAEVSQRKKIMGFNGGEYEIDVLIEFTVMGIPLRVAFECKDHKRRVARDDVMAFHAKIRDMPNTVGVFVSKAGFQAAALDYLKSFGIVYYDENTIPSFEKTVIEGFLSPLLPSERVVGEPFWGVMEARSDGQVNGVWRTIFTPASKDKGGKPKDQAMLLALFYARPDASLYADSLPDDDGSWTVRGIRQSTLSFLTTEVPRSGLGFCIVTPVEHEGRVLFVAEEITPEQLRGRYLVAEN